MGTGEHCRRWRHSGLTGSKQIIPGGRKKNETGLYGVKKLYVGYILPISAQVPQI